MIDITEHGIANDSLVEAATPNPIPKPRIRPIAPKITTPEVPRRQPPPKPERTHILEEEIKETVEQAITGHTERLELSSNVEKNNISLMIRKEVEPNQKVPATEAPIAKMETSDKEMESKVAPKDCEMEISMDEERSASYFVQNTLEITRLLELIKKETRGNQEGNEHLNVDTSLETSLPSTSYPSEPNQKLSGQQVDIPISCEKPQKEPESHSVEIKDVPPPVPETEPPDDNELELKTCTNKIKSSPMTREFAQEEDKDYIIKEDKRTSLGTDTEILPGPKELMVSMPSSTIKRDSEGSLHHELKDPPHGRQNSISSVKSLQTFSEFRVGLRKWTNLEELDDLSLASSMGPSSNNWVLGDQSETGMSLYIFSNAF